MPTIKFNGSKFPDYMYQVGTQKSSGTFSQTYKLKPMKITRNPDGSYREKVVKNGLIGKFNGYKTYKPGKPLFTNLDNEIYTKNKYTLVDFLVHLFILVIAVVIVSCIADLIFGAEEMAEVQGEVVYQVTK